jgi:hypothetical protein
MRPERTLPQAGGTNPLVDLCIYDYSSRKIIRVDARSGRPFEDAVLAIMFMRLVDSRQHGIAVSPNKPPPKYHGFCAANSDPGSAA